MFVKDIFRTKGTDVHSIGPDATADDAVHELVHCNVGSLVVYAFEGGRRCIVGIITERDILRAQAAHQAPLERLLVRDVISTPAKKMRLASLQVAFAVQTALVYGDRPPGVRPTGEERAGSEWPG